jgi:hypothetical protein
VALHYEVRVTGLARYEDIPSLTRVVDVDGVRVALFVEHLVPSHAFPKATVTGNDPRGAAREVSHQQLARMQQQANAEPAYVLLARVKRSERPFPIAYAPDPIRARTQRIAEELNGLRAVSTASLEAPDGRIVAVEPDGVARISWGWPREFVSQALAYEPAVTISAAVHDNVAVATPPARFSGPEEVDPETLTRYAADGSVLAHFLASSNSASVYLTSTYDGQTPGPETAQSRRAERDPATPNRVVIVPNHTTLRAARLGPAPQFFFTVLLSHRSYYARVSGGPHSGCLRTNGRRAVGASAGAVLRPLGEPTVRGDTFEGSTLDTGAQITCPGVYRLSISVVGPDGHPYRPFGSATFAVR